ncbi:TetR/AcrR family transcriptional regulator [Amycolatopsis regifaucium]|uniref:Transcriptional regulator n=1 Tax=Amycolatopsis regifaucium TaxID=546365 RepID=A0A154MLF0_9PSEU|nr:TetR/AcrR family transcriptional regulator [Amycolatopsis regifaucium]KZB85096.1 transcriptional regulator [Amycolatopsis regifaucium]OKA04121.1 TetR family transcriptional regulator [Amycolatopsis regifaucium]SFH94088.1 DNA-binding transcriptional regulator, AcrR family [Amycolatopsis regifaucium]
MTRPTAKERILDSYEEILIEQGPGGITLEAVAAHAGVSKGGLLYHFGSKEALVDGLMERLATLSEEDLEQARSAPEGVVSWYLRTAITDVTQRKPLHRTTMATLRIMLNEPRVSEVVQVYNQKVHDLISEHVDDPLTAELVILVGDGLYLRAALGRDDASPLLNRIDEIVTRIQH